MLYCRWSARCSIYKPDRRMCRGKAMRHTCCQQIGTRRATGGLRGAVSLKGCLAKRHHAMRSPAWAPGVTE